VNRIRVALLTVAAALLALSGCAHTGVADGDGSSFRPPSAAELDQQARAAVAKWEPILAARGTDEPFLLRIFPSEVVGGIQDDGDGGAGAFKMAWLSGKFTVGAALPSAPTTPATVRWPDGTTSSTPVMSASDTVAALQKDGSTPCQGCSSPALKVIGAEAGTRTVSSSRGPVEVPAWVFSFEGRQTKLARIAIPTDSPLFFPQAPEGTNSGDPSQKAVVSADGRSVTLTVTAAPDQPGPCGSDLTGHAIEAPHVVALVVVETSHAGGAKVACPAIGQVRNVTIPLAAPIGKRVVLGQGGVPLVLTSTRGA